MRTGGDVPKARTARTGALLALALLLTAGCAASSTTMAPPPETTPTREAPAPLPSVDKPSQREPLELPDAPFIIEEVVPAENQLAATDYTSEPSSEFESEAASEAEPQRTLVYWGTTGNRYHIDPACKAFNGKPPANQGTLEQAKLVRQSWCRFCSSDWTDERFLAQREG